MVAGYVKLRKLYQMRFAERVQAQDRLFTVHVRFANGSTGKHENMPWNDAVDSYEAYARDDGVEEVHVRPVVRV